MKKHFRKALLLFLCFFSLQMWAQEKQISGEVTGQDGMPLPGVSVFVKNTSVGTVTNFDGEFSLNVPDQSNNVLVFSFLGYTTKEVKVGDKNQFKVTLETDQEALDEVVVTALGIKREKKALGYAVQSLESEKLLEGNQTNMVNGLQGKVSGVTVANSGGAPGSSSVILIRGGTSITGNNQPLIVVDGIPIDNSTNPSNEVASANRASDINPEDIENISVLKGPAAAALYGIQAAEGAVIITTKKGKAGMSTISYSGSVSFDQVLGTPDIQTQYGQGRQLVDEEGNITYEPDSEFSWGEPIPSGTQTYNHLEDFYETAVTQNHNVSYSGGTEKSQLYLSAGDLSQEGVVEGTSYDKTSLKLNTSTKFNEDLTIGGSANYIVTETNSTKQGNVSGSSYSSLLSYPANVDIYDYLNEDGSQKRFFQEQRFDNPYWSLENSPNNDKVHRLLGILSLDYNFLDHFNVSYKLGTDYYNEFSKRVTADGSLIENREDGAISQFQKDYRRTTSNFILSYNQDITEDFNVNALVGNSVEDLRTHYTYTSGVGFQAPGIYSIANIKQADQRISEVINRKRIVGLFGEIKLSWKDALFLNATGRNDWSSTLPADKRSFFYPSVGASALVTDLFKNAGKDITSPNGLTYLKLRTTWARVGKDAPIGFLESNLGTNINGLASSAYTWTGVAVGNPDLEPEFTDSYEFGFDSRFFENRVGLDMSFYYSKSDNQILQGIRVPPTAGTFLATLNGGSIINKGIEAFLSVKVLPKTSDFQWNMTYNFGLNDSKVDDLPGMLNEVYLSDSWTFNGTAAGAAILDGSLFGLRGYRPTKNDSGQVLVESNGLPGREAAIFPDVNRIPEWTLGITNNMSYKNFNLSFLFDIVQGVDVYNATESALVFYGLSPKTLDRGETTVIDGVNANGEPNTIEVRKDQEYYQNYYSRIADNFVEDGSFARLRYVTLSYNLPSTFLDKLKIADAQFYVTGRNLLTITDYSGVDPEVNTFGAGISGAGSTGIDNLGTPGTQGVDLGLKFKF
ncbi:SusC/RagA family TonB-linked outer membrane protein [Salegentibacter chungangensis]|uniref:SusC/RagA family TonB-linked outer membrane protein n=1 Tax=Salegentibacter chungangensis TaxID=1335724 RepID=A0ABW3NLH3_9FLAO